jgi:hypothetical protein
VSAHIGTSSRILKNNEISGSDVAALVVVAIRIVYLSVNKCCSK